MARPLVLVQGGGVVIAGGPEPEPPPDPETYPPGAVAAWLLNEASGTRYDVASINHLTDFGSAGTSGGGALFDGSSQSLYRASTVDLQMGDYDWYLSAQFNLASGSGAHAIGGKWFGGPEYLLYYDGSELKFLINAGGVQSVSAGAPSLNTLHVVTAWYDSINNLMGIQLNGNSPVTASCGALTAGSDQFEIGSYGGVGSPWNGILKRITLFKGTCNSDRRALLYNSGAGLAYPTPTVTFACMGDSKTAGQSSSTAIRGYINAVRDLIPTSRLVGVLAASAPAQAATLRDATAAWIATVVTTPDLIFLNIGVNDFDGIPGNESTWQGVVQEILDALHTAWPSAQVYMAIPWKAGYDSVADSVATIRATLIGLNAFLHAGPDERTVLEGGDNGATRTSDGIHPTEAAYINHVAPAWATAAGY